MHGFVSYRRFGKVSDRAMYVLGRYVATELGWSSVARAWSQRSARAVYVFGPYVVTELIWSSRPSRVRARSLRCDRAVCVLGRYLAPEVGLCVVRWPYLSLSVADLDTCPLPSDNRYLVVRLRFEQDFTARLFAVTLRRGKNPNSNVEEGIVIDEPTYIERDGKSGSQTIVLDDLEPDSELPPKKGKPDQTKDVEKPQPDLNDRKGESKDEENVDRETQDDVDRQPAPIAPKLVISSELTDTPRVPAGKHSGSKRATRSYPKRSRAPKATRWSTKLHRAREEVMENPELSSEVQNLKERLGEHSKRLEQGAEKLNQLESENLTLRDENQALNTANNKKCSFQTRIHPMPTLETPNSGGDTPLPPMTSQRDGAAHEKAKGTQNYDEEDNESEP
ncbi:hypothetical protein F2Q69_00059726 [Brassica cretica]|uniref:Uncharacterized protein n=1 Tax=Brassica cretica TaxID=69181 RepID=A0A8S9RN72_BRACR|nr:hypothetical protein F2Q69_00059726 [Brassica cretica]